MPETLFRGQWTVNHVWKYGYISSDFLDNENFFIKNKAGKYHVAPKTISQYTTVNDQKGEKIFAGDIVKTKEFGRDDCGLNHPGYDTFMVVWHNAAWCIENSLRRFRLSDAGESLEKIGNKWDNPELVEEVNRER